MSSSLHPRLLCGLALLLLGYSIFIIVFTVYLLSLLCTCPTNWQSITSIIALLFKTHFHLLPTLHYRVGRIGNIICEHHSPQTLLLDLIFPPAYHYCKKDRSQCWTLWHPTHPFSYMSYTTIRYFVATPVFHMQYHSSSPGILAYALSR